jgi:hypothetical protein
MCEVVLPRYIVAQKCLWGGWRQPAKPVIPRPVVVSRRSAGSVKDEIPELPGFDVWEYRFWAATAALDSRSVTAECRRCLSIFSSGAARRLHTGQNGCAKKLTDAYVLLLRDGMCVICNMKSYQFKFGVPICSKACLKAWCEVETQPDALKAALALVGG